MPIHPSLCEKMMHVMNSTRVRALCRVSWYSLPYMLLPYVCSKKDVMSIRTEPRLSRYLYVTPPSLDASVFFSSPGLAQLAPVLVRSWTKTVFLVGPRCFQSSSVSDGRLTASFGVLLLRSIYIHYNYLTVDQLKHVTPLASWTLDVQRLSSEQRWVLNRCLMPSTTTAAAMAFKKDALKPACELCFGSHKTCLSIMGCETRIFPSLFGFHLGDRCSPLQSWTLQQATPATTTTTTTLDTSTR
ncbi:hypothetical protein QBC45DRAFT_129836 [Copromyces sp. CBS 386.78]|nr:hypothetical protein QBC45DRAFT_129836 [Copromyces sp. CBS 386.78]